MSELADVWWFTRLRLAQAWEGLSDGQLRWRPHGEAHSIGEILYHLAGAEHYWASRMTGRDPAATEYEARLDRAVLDGFLRDGGCPFGEAECVRASIQAALDFGEAAIRPVLERPSEAQLAMPLISPIGDHVNGREGLIRLSQHAAYHTGQIWLYRMDPHFPET